MKQYGLVIHPLLPLRAEDSELSEMTTQLLFGERVIIHEKREKWLYIENVVDAYLGWADAKMVQIIEEDYFQELAQMTSFHLETPISLIYNEKKKESKFIPAGSIIYGLDNEKFIIEEEQWNLVEPFTATSEKYQVKSIIERATQFLNAPYLWGGKSILGIDCSGFSQLTFAIGGYNLPRNASQQIECGEIINFLSEAKQGDLAFFGYDDGKITHVGILLDNENIIHASGWVKIEKIDTYGIICSSTGEYSHYLKAIRRIIS